MNKTKILNIINSFIVEEKGLPVTVENSFVDSQLDSLGTVMVLLGLNEEFGIFKGKEGDEAFIFVRPESITIKELIKLCI